MTYGLQLNIFKAGSNRWGPDWRGCVVVRNKNELHIAATDAIDHLGGNYNRSEQVLSLPSGARLYFRIVEYPAQLEQAFRGREFTQIAFLHRPVGQYADEIIDTARSRLRSRVVPTNELRYEYLNIK